MQQPKKIELYTESKTADRTLKLVLIKGHILPTKCLQRYEIKTENSKSMMSRLTLQDLVVKMNYLE